MLEYKDYCDNQVSDELEKLGYPRYHYDATEVDKIFRIIPLYAAQKWLREKKNLHIEITYSPSCWTGKIYDLKAWDYIKGFTFFESFEDALHTLINEAVKILKK